VIDTVGGTLSKEVFGAGGGGGGRLGAFAEEGAGDGEEVRARVLPISPTKYVGSISFAICE
jgi:hypothetical protein